MVSKMNRVTFMELLFLFFLRDVNGRNALSFILSFNIIKEIFILSVRVLPRYLRVIMGELTYISGKFIIVENLIKTCIKCVGFEC